MTFDAFAPILAMLALGYVFQRMRVLPDDAAQTLNLVVLYVCLPAAVLRYAPRPDLEPALIGIAPAALPRGRARGWRRRWSDTDCCCR